MGFDDAVAGLAPVIGWLVSQLWLRQGVRNGEKTAEREMDALPPSSVGFGALDRLKDRRRCHWFQTQAVIAD